MASALTLKEYRTFICPRRCADHVPPMRFIAVDGRKPQHRAFLRPGDGDSYGLSYTSNVKMTGNTPRVILTMVPPLEDCGGCQTPASAGRDDVP